MLLQAFDQDLAIVPVLNKVDLPSAEPDKVAEQMQQVRAPSRAITAGPAFWAGHIQSQALRKGGVHRRGLPGL